MQKSIVAQIRDEGFPGYKIKTLLPPWYSHLTDWTISDIEVMYKLGLIPS